MRPNPRKGKRAAMNPLAQKKEEEADESTKSSGPREGMQYLTAYLCTPEEYTQRGKSLEA